MPRGPVQPRVLPAPEPDARREVLDNRYSRLQIRSGRRHPDGAVIDLRSVMDPMASVLLARSRPRYSPLSCSPESRRRSVWLEALHRVHEDFLVLHIRVSICARITFKVFKLEENNLIPEFPRRCD